MFIAAALAGLAVTICALIDDWKRGARIAAAPWIRVALRYGAIAPAVLLFLLTLRRSGERAGRLAERSKPSRRSMTSNARCSTRQLAVLVIAAISLIACATATFDPRMATVCPPCVEHSREVQAHAADELDLLPDGSAIAELLSESVMRDQAWACCQ